MLAGITLSSALLSVLGAAIVAMGIVAAVFALYLLVLAVAALFYVEPACDRDPSSRLIVLVPAHNESELISRCVRSLCAQAYPRALYQVVVIADNCTDDTAAVARHAGADLVLERNEPDARGKGHALRWAMDRLLPTEPTAAAFAVIDADSVAGETFLSKLVRPFEAGARAVQGESLLAMNAARGTGLRVTAFLLVNRVRPAGRTVLGLPMSHLAGNGMLLARELLLAKPWRAFTSAEDLEYSLELQSEGIPIVFAGGAVLMSPAAPNPQAAAEQQLRWEGGKIFLARTRLPALVRRAVRERQPALLGVAFDLAVPPLGLLTVTTLGGALIAGAVAALGLVPALIMVPWLAGLASIPLHVLIGLRAGHAPRSAYLTLLRAPLFLLTKPFRAHRALRFRGDTWVRTERAPAQSDL